MAIGHLYRGILASGRTTAEDVARLQEEIRADGLVDSVEAEILFRLCAECTAEDGSWSWLFVDALTDFYVWHREPRGHIDDAQAEHLLAHIFRDGRVVNAACFELLVNIVYWAGFCPIDLVNLVLKTVCDSILDPDSAVSGRRRLPNVIDAVDVEILRKAIYAPSAAGGIMISRAEAELLFDLNNAAAAAHNHPAWRDLFVTAVANHLMFPKVSPATTTAEKCSRLQEAWNQQSDSDGDIRDVIDRALDGDAEAFVLLNAERKQVQQDHAARDAAIDAEEAEWLRRQIAADSRLHENEVELLRHLKAMSPDIHVSLSALFAAAGVV